MGPNKSVPAEFSSIFIMRRMERQNKVQFGTGPQQELGYFDQKKGQVILEITIF
jgi:hypothetical protein